MQNLATIDGMIREKSFQHTVNETKSVFVSFIGALSERGFRSYEDKKYFTELLLLWIRKMTKKDVDEENAARSMVRDLVEDLKKEEEHLDGLERNASTLDKFKILFQRGKVEKLRDQLKEANEHLDDIRNTHLKKFAKFIESKLGDEQLQKIFAPKFDEEIRKITGMQNNDVLLLSAPKN